MSTIRTATMTRAAEVAILAHAESLRERAASLRFQAEALPSVLATTYRRRASELELEAFLTELQADSAYGQLADSI